MFPNASYARTRLKLALAVSALRAATARVLPKVSCQPLERTSSAQARAETDTRNKTRLRKPLGLAANNAQLNLALSLPGASVWLAPTSGWRVTQASEGRKGRGRNVGRLLLSLASLIASARIAIKFSSSRIKEAGLCLAASGRLNVSIASKPASQSRQASE